MERDVDRLSDPWYGRLSSERESPDRARWGTMCAVELILFPSYLCLGTGQGFFHGGAIKIGQVFVEFPIMEETLSECVGCGLLIAEWNGDLLLIETSDVVSEKLSATLLEAVEVN